MTAHYSVYDSLLVP